MKQEGHPSIRERLLANETIRNKIAFRAYQIFEERGRLHGYDKEDWQQAETEILSEWIAHEEGRLQAEEGHPVRKTRVAGTRPKRREGTSGERQAIRANTAVPTSKRGKEPSRANIKQKAAPGEVKSTTEPKLEPQKKDPSGPKNRKKKAASEISSSL